MYSSKLILYCLLISGGWLLVASIALYWIERALKLTRGIPTEMLESGALGWSAVNFIMEAMFYVAIPTIGFNFFYLIIPLYGIKAGMAAAVFSFTLGAAPVLMSLSVRVKLPMPYMLYLLLSHLIKLTGSLVIISYLYSL